MDQPIFHIGEVWRWPSEPDKIRFIVGADTRAREPLGKMEFVLKQTDNPTLFDFLVEYCPPLDESTAPNYVKPPS